MMKKTPAGKRCRPALSLRGQIMAEIETRGWLVVPSAVPDFVILTDTSHLTATWYVDLQTSKSTLGQLAFRADARKLGQTVHVVGSVEEFKELFET